VRRAALAAVPFLALAVPATAAAPPARVQVSAQEFAFTLSRTSIKSGRAIVQLVNFGEDPHDLRLRRIGGTRTYGTRVVLPGGSADLIATLAAGKYVFWCSIADHRARGMRGTLVVRR
jgi:plastocyanin